MTSEITFRLGDLAEQVPDGESVVVARLFNATGQQTGPINLDNGHIVSPAPLHARFDSQGVAKLNLIQTRHLPNTWRYVVDVILPRRQALRWTDVAIPDSDREWLMVAAQHDPGTVPDHVTIPQEELTALLTGIGLRISTAAPVSGTGSIDSPVTVADGAIGKAKLAQGVQDDLGGAVDASTIQAATDDSRFFGEDNEGNQFDITLPVSGFRARNALQALPANDRLAINAGTSGNLPAARVSGIGAHADVAAVEAKADANASKIDGLEAFESALRSESQLFAGQQWTQGLSNAATRLPARPAVPAAQADARLRFAFGGDGTASGGTELDAFRAMSRVGGATQLDTSNSLAISGSGRTFHVAFGTNGDFVVACSAGGSYTLTAWLDVVQVKDEQLETAPRTDAQVNALANARINALVPASTRPPVPKAGDAGKAVIVNDDEDGLELGTVQASGGGLDTAAVNAAIDARIPVIRRVPVIAGADAGKVLKVNASGTVADWEDDETGGGSSGGTAVPWRITTARRTTQQGDLRTPATGSIGTDWTTEQNLIDYTVPADSAGGLIVFVHARATSPAGVGGGDRIYIQVNMYRVRGAASLSLTDKVYYIRNSGQLNAAGNAASRRGDVTFALPIDVQAGDVIRANVQAIAQVGGRNSVTWARTTNDLMILRPPSGAGGGGLSTAQVNALINAALPANRRPPAISVGQALQHLRVNAAGNGLEWAALPASGLTQTQVDARINAAIPAKRRVPDFAAGDANEVVKVNATGTALVIAPETPGGLSQAQVDARVNALAPGLATTAARSAIQTRVELFAQDGTGDLIPESRLPKKLDDFLDAADDQGWQDAGSSPATDIWVANTTFGGTNIPNPATRTFVRSFQVSPRRTNRNFLLRVPNTYTLDEEIRMAVGSDALGVTSAFLSGTWTFLASVGSYSYYASPQVANIDAGERVRAQLYRQFHLDPDKIDNVLPDGGADGDIVRRRSGRPVWEGLSFPHSQLYQDGPGTGLALTSGNQQSALTGLTTPLDLDSVTRGELAVAFTLALSGRSSNTIGFGTGGSDQTHRVDGIFTATDLRDLANYAVGSAATWLQVGNTADVYAGASKIGEVRVVLGHDANNVVGYSIHYTRTSGAHTLTVTPTVRVFWSPTDAPEGSGGSAPVLVGQTGVTLVSANRWTTISSITETTLANYNEICVSLTLTNSPLVAREPQYISEQGLVFGLKSAIGKAGVNRNTLRLFVFPFQHPTATIGFISLRFNSSGQLQINPTVGTSAVNYFFYGR